MIIPSSQQRVSFLGALLLLLALSTPAFSAVLRVKADAPGPVHDGATWGAAFATVQAALDAAFPGDELWVAAGLYKESVTLKAGVSVYGGFAGGESHRDPRDSASHETILDGQEERRVVLMPPGNGPATVLDGLTIRNGSTHRETMRGGAGILCNGGSLVVRFCRVIGNLDGGVACTAGGSLDLLNSVVQRNTGAYGGVRIQDSRAEIHRSLITENNSWATADGVAGGVSADGSALTLRDNVITDNRENSSRSTAGGVAVKGTTCVVENNRVSTNTGPTGGILAIGATVRNNIVSGNGGWGAAGGLFASGRAVVTGNTLVANAGVTAGGAVFSGAGNTASNNLIAFNGSGIALDTAVASSVSLSHNCLFGNAEFDVSGLPDPAGAHGNISADPLLVSYPNGNLHLQASSPCRDAGDDAAVTAGAKDMDGAPRVQGSHVDIGADESDGTTGSAETMVLHVRPDGDDAADGRTWRTAKATPQAAVDALAGAGGEVWVAEGTYGPSSDRDAVVVVPPFVRLYGGFAGNETHREQRDWRAHRTVVDGHTTHMGFHLTGGYRVSVVDGFTVTHTDDRGGWAGAAIMSAPVAGPTISHNTLTGNRMGRLFSSWTESVGALAVGGPALVTNNVISDNISDAPGIFVYGGSPEFRNNTVVGNSGDFGAALWLGAQMPGTPLFINNLFAFNTGGVRASSPPETQPVFRHNCFFENGPRPFFGVEDPVGTNGNIAADPLLAEFLMGDNHLTAASPCVDAGEDFAGAREARDMDAEARLIGERVDIGADEYSGHIPVQPRRVIRVGPRGSDDADGSTWEHAVRTIQRGVDLAAENGGEVWVAAGTYPEHVVVKPHVFLYGGFLETAATREDRDPAGQASVIEPSGEGTVVSMVDTGVYAALDGFTLRGGEGEVGGGLAIVHASPDVTDNVLTGNTASFGGAIALDRSYARVWSNTIHDNAASLGGGGIATRGGAPLIERNLIRDNRTDQLGGGVLVADGTPRVRDNVVAGNMALQGSGVAVASQSASPVVTNNTFVANTTSPGVTPQGAILGNYGLRLENNIIAFNDAGINSVRGSPMARSNDVFGNAGGDFLARNFAGWNGNISVDPLFMDASAGDYRLAPGSPVRDAGADDVVSPGERDMDGRPRIQGYHVDMGAHEADFIPPPFPDAVKALRAGAGLDALTPEDAARLNVATDGASAETVDLQDALALLRAALSSE